MRDRTLEGAPCTLLDRSRRRGLPSPNVEFTRRPEKGRGICVKWTGKRAARNLLTLWFFTVNKCEIVQCQGCGLGRALIVGPQIGFLLHGAILQRLNSRWVCRLCGKPS